MISVHLRAPEALIRRLDEFAAERGVDRSRLMRQLLDAGLADRPSPLVEAPTEAELLSLLAEKARAGNVAAIRSLLAREQENDPRARLLMAFEQMAEERRQ